MKYLIFTFCLVFCYVDAERNTTIYIQATEKCAAEIGVERDNLEKFLDENRENPSQKMKCFVKCYLLETGMMDEEGNIRADPNDETTQEEIEIENECKKFATETELRERAFNFSQCCVEKRKQRMNQS